MQVHLMNPEQAFDWRQPLPDGARDLAHDLALDGVLSVMAGDDAFIRRVMEHALLCSVADTRVIRYRQAALQDCLNHSLVIREMYDLVCETLEKRRRYYLSGLASSPSSKLHAASDLIEMMAGSLSLLRDVATDARDLFQSEGLRALITRLEQDLSEEYLDQMKSCLRELKFKDGIHIGMQLGRGGKGVDYVLRGPGARPSTWRILSKRRPTHSFRIADRDEAGYRALADIQDRGLLDVSKAVVQAAENMVDFFVQLKTEIAFYLGCVHLINHLRTLQLPLCVPDPLDPESRGMRFDGLYDVGLALEVGGQVVGNTLSAEDVSLVVVTGANQGGKSTFLRSLGLAQLFMQCGMYVPAKAYEMSMAQEVQSHFSRMEDAGMDRGKLDDELSRMSDVVDSIGPHSLLLMNESFAATNEREGAEIARGVVEALVDSGVKVVFVTHLWAFAEEWYNAPHHGVLFLRAERLSDGSRSYKMIQGPPLETSFGVDLYRQIFTKTENLAEIADMAGCGRGET